jgi:site-specific recombinase XerD
MSSFSELIEAFKSHCRFEKNLSFRSIKAYMTDLTQLTDFLADRGENGISEIIISNQYFNSD